MAHVRNRDASPHVIWLNQNQLATTAHVGPPHGQDVLSNHCSKLPRAQGAKQHSLLPPLSLIQTGCASELALVLRLKMSTFTRFAPLSDFHALDDQP
jgi:hypothetical protein